MVSFYLSFSLWMIWPAVFHSNLQSSPWSLCMIKKSTQSINFQCWLQRLFHLRPKVITFEAKGYYIWAQRLLHLSPEVITFEPRGYYIWDQRLLHLSPEVITFEPRGYYIWAQRLLHLSPEVITFKASYYSCYIISSWINW